MGEELRKLSSVLGEAMQAKNMSLEKLSQVSHISERFLIPLLSDKFEKLPASPYLHGYILKITGILNLDGEKIWEIYFKNSDYIRKSGKSDELPKNRFAKIRVNRRTFIIGIIVLVFLVYSGWKIQAYFSPPPLTLHNFSDNMVVETSEFTLKGNEDPRNQMFLNGEQIYPDAEGNFEKVLTLQPGFNALSFKIKKFLGREYIIEKQIYYKAPAGEEEKKLPLETNNGEEENKPTDSTE